VLTQALLIYDTMRASVPTLVEGILGRIEPRAIDERILRWGSDCVRHAGLEIDVEGKQRVDWSRSYVVMTNHQSYLDIPAIAVALDGKVRFVAKKELFRIPVFGPAMKAAGIVRIDRQNREAAIASLREAAAALRGAGHHIWIAPEGTRSLDGKLGPLKKGGFVLAVDTGAPILPAAVIGTRDAMRPKGGWTIRRGVRARIVFGAPVETTGR
jgi:1-acyl-sn-glycerol-3-phosphate acyltransferase